MSTLYSMVNETGNRNRILEMCKFRIWVRLKKRPQFFSDFHQILRAAHKCGRFDAYCLRDKPEVVSDFRGVRIQILAVFRLW